MMISSSNLSGPAAPRPALRVRGVMILALVPLLAGIACDSGSSSGAARDDVATNAQRATPVAPAAGTSDGDGGGSNDAGTNATGAAAREDNGTPPAAPGGRPAAWSLSAGSIVYESHAGDRVDIHRFDAGAPRPVALTSRPARDLRPRWSPDGRRVAFHSDASGNNDVWLVDADGGNLRRITDHPGEDFDPDWMPDGRLLFASDRDGDQNIWMIDLDSGALEQLTRYPDGRTGGPTPAGDGRRIAFSSDRRFSWQVYVLDLASGNVDRITGPLPGRCNPAWNPVRDEIAYMAGGDLIGTDLQTIDPAGETSRDLASNAGDNQDPQYSQDGRRLVWVSDRDGSFDIYEARADGSRERRVSNTPEDERHPDLYLRDPR